jgi:poly(ribitol-phosphate) beta-N-acetylglucosaminyltransferase
MSPPDVTVVVTVYNTMPHLRRCLTSLVRQTIGLDRIRVVAVDDGSTDGSGRELDRFARRYPGAFTVIHQANSGGPAGPCNRALDAATGRYVFFVGSDDHLGRDALRRLVDRADAYGSDVVLGRVVGVNGRFIYQDIFVRDEVDVGLADSPLPRSLANTKLFRRELLERHGIRYPEHMPVGSDQPFTLEACYRARRISVLADYDYYHLVRRFSASNITYRSRHADRLRAVEAMMAFTAELIEPGKERDAVLAARFGHEVTRLLGDDFLGHGRDTQRLLHDGVGRLARAYLTGEVADQLSAEARIRIGLARGGGLDDLIAVIRQDAQAGVPLTLVEGGRRYARYPGFRDPGGPPDSCFDVTGAADWPVRLDVRAVAWETGERGRVLTVTAYSPLPGVGDKLVVSAEEVGADTRVIDRGEGGEGGTTVRVTLAAADLLAASHPTGQRRTVSAQAGPFDLVRALSAGGTTGVAGVAALRLTRPPRVRPALVWWRARPYLVVPVRDEFGRLVVSVVPVTLRRVLVRVEGMARRLVAYAYRSR